MITTDGQLVTIAGLAAYADGVGSAARFSGPVGIRVIENGAIIVADTSNYVIRLLTLAGSRRRAALRFLEPHPFMRAAAPFDVDAHIFRRPV
jgi:hypothetical protein